MDFSLTPDVRYRQYYVIFQKAHAHRWWNRWFTVPGFEHCSVLEVILTEGKGLAAGPCCVHTETCFGLTVQRIWWEDAEKLASKLLANRGVTAVARLEVDKKYAKRYIPFGMFTCVTIVKSILGIHNWRVQTPQRLLKYLEGQGALVMRR